MSQAELDEEAAQRLLSDGADDEDVREQKATTPLPKMQIGLLCLLRASNPLLFRVVFPYLPAMLVELGIAPDEIHVGYHTGMIEAAMTFSRCLLALYWARWSDRWGRRPVLLLAVALSALTAIGFGFARTFLTLVAWRMFQGATNGQANIAKTMVAESTDETNKSLAFTFVSSSWQLGGALGPLIGAMTAHLDRSFPSFQRISFFRDFPYAPPPIFSALIISTVFAVGIVRLHETLPARLQVKSTHTLSPLPFHTRYAIAILSVLSLQDVCNFGVFPLALFTPIGQGGLGATTAEIGAAYAVRSVCIILVEMGGYRKLQPRYGTKRLMRAAAAAYSLVFALWPVVVFAASRASPRSPLIYLLVLGIILAEACAQTVFIASDVLTTDAAPTRSHLAYVGGVSAIAQQLGQLIGALAVSALFAWSITSRLLAGQAVWVVLLLQSIVITVAVLRMSTGPSWRDEVGETEQHRPM